MASFAKQNGEWMVRTTLADARERCGRVSYVARRDGSEARVMVTKAPAYREGIDEDTEAERVVLVPFRPVGVGELRTLMAAVPWGF